MIKKISYALLLTMLFISICCVAYADNKLDLIGWATPDTIFEGEQTQITLQFSNHTGQRVYISGYSIDNVTYEYDLILENGIGDTIFHDFTPNFGSNNSVSVPIYIAYDFDGDGYYLNDSISNGSPVQINKSTPPVPTLDFNVTADSTSVNEGDWVNYTITCKNTCNIDFDGFTVVTNMSNIETFDLLQGNSKTLYYSEQYFSDTQQDFGYYFYYNGGWYCEELCAQSFNVKVSSASPTQQGPSDTPTPTPSPTKAATPSPTPAVNSTPSSNQAPAAAATPTPVAGNSNSNNSSNNSNQGNQNNQSSSASSNNNTNNANPTASTDSQSGNQQNNSNKGLMITLIVVCSLLVISVIVLAVIILKKNKQE